jgi:hypothetical protein
VCVGEDVDLSKIQDPHTVCGLMKQYLRELPGTLPPSECTVLHRTRRNVLT